jgi:hypothetical protein
MDQLSESEILELMAKMYKEENIIRKLNLIINFQRKTSEINFRNHRTDEIQHLNPSYYEIVDLNLDKVFDAVFSKIEPHYELSFSKGKLIVDIYMKRLIKFIEKGNAIAPPILELSGKSVILRDGKHRMGLLRFLKFKSIPFLVKKNSAENFTYLI